MVGIMSNKIKIFDTEHNTVLEYGKSQTVRLYDVFLLGPFLAYIGYKAKGIEDWERAAVYIIAAGTTLYNGRNYLKNKQREARESNV